MKRVYLLFWSTIPLLTSLAQGTEDESHTLPSHVWETNNDKAFVRVAEKVFDGTHLVDTPIKNADGYILAQFIMEIDSHYYERPCMLSADRGHCIFYQLAEGEAVALRLTLESGFVSFVQKIKDDSSLIEIPNSPLLHQKAPTELTSIGVAQAIGQPNNVQFTVENGVFKVRGKSLFQEGQETRARLLGEIANLSTAVRTVQTTLDTQVTDLNASLTETLNSVLAEFRTASLSQMTESLNLIKNHLSRTVYRQREQGDIHTDTAISALQHDLTQLVSARADRTDHELGESTATIKNTIQSIMGVALRHDGRPENGSVREQIEDSIVHAYQYLGMTDEMQQAFNAVAHVLSVHGGLPILYWNSIESMLFGHTVFGRTPVVKPLTEYLSDIESWMSHSDHFMGYLRPWKKDISQKIISISEFFQNSSDTTIMRVLPEIIRLFGTKFPSYETPSLNIARYCNGAHFSEEDFGLYGWVKDIYSVFEKFMSYRGPDLAQQATDSRLAFERLQRGAVVDRNKEKLAIPLTHFYGLRTYKEILDECTKIIARTSQRSFEGRFESRSMEIVRKEDAIVNTLGAAVQKITETCENIIRYTFGIPGGIDGLEELVNRCVFTQLHSRSSSHAPRPPRPAKAPSQAKGPSGS
jgi:hypothetical protein